MHMKPNRISAIGYPCRAGIAAVLCSVLVALAPAQDAWEPRGIGGGGALFVPSISPHDPNEIFMATDMSAVFHTDDFGDAWRVIDFTQITGGIDTPVRFTSDPNVLYSTRLSDVVWGYRTPIKSTDGGATWSPLAGDPTDHEAYFLDADPDRTNRVILANYSDVYYSSDGGASFTLIYNTPGSQPDARIAGVVWDDDRIIIGTKYGLIVSENGGASFGFAQPSGLPADWGLLGLCGARAGGTLRLFATARHRGDMWPGMSTTEWWSDAHVYRMDWGAGAWTQLPDPPLAMFPFHIDCARNDIDTVWVSGGNQSNYVPTVARSTNAGASWTSVFNTNSNANIATGWCGDSGDLEWWWAESPLGFTVSPTDPDRAVITDWGFAHVTDDGGATWRAAYVAPESRNTAGADTPNGGAYTTSGVEDTSVWWLHWVDASTIFAAFTDVDGLRSTDGGHSWTSGRALGLPHSNTYHVVEHPATNVLYAATSSVHDLYQSTYLQDSNIDGGSGEIAYSTDGGASWNTLHDFGHPVIWLALDPAHPNTLYASVVHSSAGDIYVTYNLSAGPAATWQRLASPPRTEGHPFNVHVLNDGALLATYSGRRDAGGAFTTSSGVFLSTDGGASWLDRSDANMLRWTKDVIVDPHDPTQNTWYATVFSHWGAFPNELGGLYRTTNRGLSWTLIGDFYRVNSATVHPDDPNMLYLSTESEGLWITENLQNASPTFERVSDYPFMQPMRIFFNPFDTDEVWVTSFGNGMRVKRFAAPSCTVGDALALLSCMSGPGVGLDPGCSASDRDGDADSDLADFADLQECVSE